MSSWLGQVMNKIQKDPTPNCHFEMLGAEAGYWCLILAHTTTKGVGSPPKPPLRPYAWICPYPHPT